MTPLKTSGQLYEDYKNQCVCGHVYDFYHSTYIGEEAKCRVCDCQRYTPLTPIQISELIESYYETYAERKALLEK